MHRLRFRVQVLIDEDRYRRVRAEALERGVSMAEVVRDAIDRSAPPTKSQRRAAAKAILEAEPTPMPDIDELKRELDEIRGGGL